MYKLKMIETATWALGPQSKIEPGKVKEREAEGRAERSGDVLSQHGVHAFSRYAKVGRSPGIARAVTRREFRVCTKHFAQSIHCRGAAEQTKQRW